MKTQQLVSLRRIVRDASDFESAISELLDNGFAKTRGAAILLAKKHCDASKFNSWMRKRLRTDDGKRAVQYL